MKILEFKGNEIPKKLSLKNKILFITVSVIFIIITCTVLIYMLNENAREWINIYILRKEINEDDIATIELEVDKKQYIYAYDRYISVLCNGKLSIYNSYANKEAEIDIAISNPIYDRTNGYMGIAESGGQRLCLVADSKILWENKVEGSISKINVSRSGYVSVITTGTGYKSVIVTFDRNGNELFKTYRSSAIAIDTDISVNGDYLAIAEVSASGTSIESSINIIDMEKAKKGENNPVVFMRKSDSNKLITDIKYQEKGQLVCIYDDSIHMIYQDEDTELVKFSSNTKIADINLKSNVIRAEEISTSLFSSKTDIILKNILTGTETVYAVNNSIKEIVSYNHIAAINLGTEIHFINLNGWLEKKYTSNQEAKEIVLGTSIAGIVYRDRIKILSF